MNEVSAATVGLVLDAILAHGLPLTEIWPASRSTVPHDQAAMDWEEWAALMHRLSAACDGLLALEELFVSGAGARAGHPFVRLASSFVSLRDVYGLLARWGLPRSAQVMRSRFVEQADGQGLVVVEIDAQRIGSEPTLRFLVGMFRSVPTIVGLEPAKVRLRPTITPHRAENEIELPRRVPLRTRLRQITSLATGAQATIDELARQAREIARQNELLSQKLRELTAAAAVVRERDEWLALAMDVGRIGVYQTDLVTGQVTSSPSIARMMGLPDHTEASSQEWLARIHPDDRERVTRLVASAMAEGHAVELDHRTVHPSGAVRWVRATARLVTGADGQARLLGTATDITEQKRLESKLRLTDRMIATGTLAAGVAHEVNNPLGFVLANVELLLAAEDVGAASRERLREVADGLLRIRDVVRDLHAFARPEEEVVQLVDAREVVASALRLTSSYVQKHAVLAHSVAREPCLVSGNEARLGQVLVNLIMNACQALPDRPSADNRVSVRVLGGAGQVTIEVEDNGVGIAPEVMPSIFDPFFTTKPGQLGSGLGLCVCQSIVSAMGGQIEVETALGAGSTFRLRLPQRDPPNPEQPVAQPRTRAVRVLVVDDEPMMRRAIATLLRNTPVTVTLAEDAASAQALALSGEFDVLLCDLMMPVMSGSELVSRLVELGSPLARHVVFMSGGASQGEVRAVDGHHQAVVLPKPFDRASLLRALQQAAAPGD